MSGIFITFEGVEGAGKTTQIGLLTKHLADAGYTVFATREPGGEPVAEAIRRVVLGESDATAASDHPTPSAELLLFLAARAQVVERVIRPHLSAGELVICDRYIDSTTAYQGYARGHNLDWVRRLNDYATGGLKPDITVLLDMNPVAGLERQADRNRMEAEPIAFHQCVREGFLAEAKREPDRFAVIDAGRSIAEIHADIIQAVRDKLSLKVVG